MKAQSALSVKEANLKAMTAFIYTQGSATKQMFEHELGLSLPTITQNLRAMEADGLIVKGEMQQSTGGRKAQIYEFAAHSSVAIGVRIQTTQITAIAIDLNGKSVATRQRTLPYRNNDAYYQRMNGIINDFARDGIPATLSSDAGTFVCNSLFYQLLHWTATQDRVLAGFVSFPPINGGSRLQNGLDLRQQVRAGRDVVRETVRYYLQPSSGDILIA